MKINLEKQNVKDQGKRFSLVYSERGTPIQDKQQFRTRLAAYYLNNFQMEDWPISTYIQMEAGIEISREDNISLAWNVFKKGQLWDMLDTITLIYKYLIHKDDSIESDAHDWKKFVERALREENMGYRIDNECGVHYYVDEEFEHNRISTLLALEDSRFVGVRAAFEDAYRHLDGNPQDTKASVRSMFESLEILVKQMVKVERLTKGTVQHELKEKCFKLYNTDEIGQKVIVGLLDSFAEWVNTLHNYRHGQVSEEPITPDEQITIHILSTGSSYLRWLSEMEIRLSR